MRHIDRKHLLLAIIALTLMGCSDDEPAVTLLVSTPNDQISFDGTETTSIFINLVRGDSPTGPGTSVQLSAVEAGSGAPTGRFERSGTPETTVVLDASGAGIATFLCSEEGTARIVLTHPSASTTIDIECIRRWPGDWVLGAISTDRLALRPGGVANLSVPVRTAQGDRVPDNVAIRFEVVEGDGGFGSPSAPTVEVHTVNGTVSAAYRASTDEMDRVIELQVSFANTSQGDSVQSLSLTVSLEALAEPEVQIEPARSLLRADGEAEVALTVRVFATGNIPLATDVQMMVDLGTLRTDGGEGATEVEVRTDASGEGQLAYIAADIGGVATIRATVPAEAFPDPPSSDVIALARVDLVPLDAIVWLNDTLLPLSVRGDPRQTRPQTEVCFEVTAETIGPVDGIPVTFEIQESTSTGASLDPLEATSDEAGLVCTTLTAGDTAGAVTIYAAGSLGGQNEFEITPPLPVVGATPSRAGLSVDCEVDNLGALRHLQGGQIAAPVDDTWNLCTTCRATLLDRADQPVGFEFAVVFLAEVGSFPDGPEVVNDIEGVATARWCADGADLPADVAPQNDEPSWVDGTTVLNPRDGMVSIVAYVVDGEEAFDDVDGDGAWEPGEAFWDQGEPFVDQNDNGVRDDDEAWDEVGESDEVYDPGNALWDDHATIWAETRLVLSGRPAFGFFPDGVDAGTAPDSLPHDADYPAPAALSHWHVTDAAEVSLGNRYPSADANPVCDGSDAAHCIYADSGAMCTDWEPLSVWYAARDMFGNPMNGSLDSLVVPVPDACESAIMVAPQALTPAPGEPAFSMQETSSFVVEEGTEIHTYRLEVLDFAGGSAQELVVSPGTACVPAGGCALQMVAPLTACESCTDAPDIGPWPTVIFADR